MKQHSVPPERIEFVGHSLGAHISGFIGKHIQKIFNKSLLKITGMDPPNLEFERSNGLEKGDADIVSIIHTDSAREEAYGSVDFYPNGGFAPQPGCPESEDSGILAKSPQKYLLN